MTASRSASGVRRYRVSGRVQGVGFRAATAGVARRLGLSGWVRNRRDGTVEVLACGSEERLGEFGSWLRAGPPGARVEGVEETPSDGEAPENDSFEISPTL